MRSISLEKDVMLRNSNWFVQLLLGLPEEAETSAFSYFLNIKQRCKVGTHKNHILTYIEETKFWGYVIIKILNVDLLYFFGE